MNPADVVGSLIAQAVAGSKPAKALDDAKTKTGVASDRAYSYLMQDCKLKTAAVINEWLETDDLDGDETIADRLLNMFIGIIDENKNGELDDDEQDDLEDILNCAWDYFIAQGVDEGDVSTLLNDWDPDVAENVRELLASSLGEGDGESINEFAFGSDQSAVFDAAYKMVTVVRNGKKKRIGKRISGNVRMSAKQKLALRKAQRRARSSAAKNRRKRSNRVRENLGLKSR